ncbi:DnaB-like helicase N-terminal domain-containing protein [Gordonia sputi]
MHDDTDFLADDAGDTDTELAESRFLSALLWSSPGDRSVTATLALVVVEDFYLPAHAQLYSTISTLITAEPRRDHTPAGVLAELQRHTGLTGHHGQILATTLRAATTTGALPAQAPHYAAMVVADAYRRAFRAAGDGIAHAATALPEDDLWEYMCQHGRALRTHRARLAALRAATHP